ncbi:MAG TPA: hypothetical protein ACHBZA_12785 [Arsenophonus apicola]
MNQEAKRATEPPFALLGRVFILRDFQVILKLVVGTMTCSYGVGYVCDVARFRQTKVNQEKMILATSSTSRKQD